MVADPNVHPNHAPVGEIVSQSRRHFIFGVSALAGMAAVAPVQAQPATDRAKARHGADIAKALHAAQPAPALSLAVARAGGLVWAAAYGKSDLELDVAATPQHSFRLGSVSKLLTSTTAAKLLSRRILDLDAPISTWLADLPAQHRQTTVKQLLTHRGGIRHYSPSDLDPSAPGGAIYQRVYPTNKEILALFIDDPLIAPPGARISYSSFGFTLASLVMEAAAGRPFTELVQADIGGTFGLPSLGKDDPIALMPLRASGYSNAADMAIVSRQAAAILYARWTAGWANIPLSNPAYCWAGAGFLMTPSDLARFGAALLDSPASKITRDERTLLFTPLTEKTNNMPPLGLAWRIDTDTKGRRRWHHAGATLGGRASLVVYPDLGLSIVLASNVMSVPGNVLAPSSNLADAFSS